MEKRINTPEKYKFPNFETVHWFAAPHILEQLKGLCFIFFLISLTFLCQIDIIEIVYY